MSKQIYRFQFSNECTQLLNRFAQIHQYDDRPAFQAAWALYKIEHQELFNSEIQYHQENKYSKDVSKKMYESVRFYHRKKLAIVKSKPSKKAYQTFRVNTLNEIDAHLKDHHHEKPSVSFNHYYSEIQNKPLPFAQMEMTSLAKQNCTESEIKEKLKKTYKNRYYTFIKKLSP